MKHRTRRQGTHGARPAPQPISVDQRPLVMDEEAAAAKLGVSPRTLQRWRSGGRGPAYARLGKLPKYRLEDLEAFVAQHRVLTPEAAA